MTEPGRTGSDGWKPSKGTKNTMMGLAALAMTVLGSCTYLVNTTYIAPGEQGIRELALSPFGLFGQVGVQREVYGPGRHIKILGFHTMHVLPADIQVYNLLRSAVSLDARDYDRNIRRGPAARIETSDGFYVDLDVSVIYRIDDPYELVTTLGAGELYFDNGVAVRTVPNLKAKLGELDPVDFYNVALRVPQQDSARNRLDDELSGNGLTIEHVLIRYPAFHTEIQERFEERVTQQQNVLTNRAEAGKTTVSVELTRLTEQGEQAASVRIAEGLAYAVQRAGEGDAYVRIRNSDGSRLVALADAEATRLINNSYRGAGSDLLVGLKMAENLKNLPYILITPDSFNPLDVANNVDVLSGARR